MLSLVKMKIKLDMPEGGTPASGFCFGRILTHVRHIDEYYFSFCAFGKRFFFASGRYGYPFGEGPRRFRYWIGPLCQWH